MDRKSIENFAGLFAAAAGPGFVARRFGHSRTGATDSGFTCS
jgi:hypothetical protein